MINFIENFECSVCRALHEQIDNPSLKFVAEQNHYGCPPPTSVLDSLENRPSRPKNKYWLEEWHKSSLEAEKFREMIENETYSPPSYHQEILRHLIKSGHFNRFPPPFHNEL